MCQAVVAGGCWVLPTESGDIASYWSRRNFDLLTEELVALTGVKKFFVKSIVAALERNVMMGNIEG